MMGNIVHRWRASLLSSATPVIVSGALVMSVALGIRQTFGLFVLPFSFDRGVPVTVVAFALALHNLVWGVTQPFAGAAADRYGAAPVVAFGAVVFALGLALAAMAPSGLMLVVGIGLLVGTGISCTSFGVVLAAAGRAVTLEKRSMAMGIVSAGGSFGQCILVPLTQVVTDHAGMTTALLVLAGLMLATAPLGVLLDLRGPGGVTVRAMAAPSLRVVLAQACRHPGYRLLTTGFFVCGFQLAFIGTYLPGYLSLCHMPIGLGATALALIGFFNMAGSWGCGLLGGRFRQQSVLGWLYLVRGATIALFMWLPKTQGSVVAFAVVMGLTWLGTVPLTSGWVAKVFGTQHLGALFGVCFLSHQIGSFLGAWSGGLVFDLTGSYSLVWCLAAAGGLVAAMLHFPIRDRPIPAVVG